MEALQAALASLVALEARAMELVSPVEAIADAVKAVVKEAAIVVENLHGRVTQLEQLEARVAALEAHPAVSVPPLVAAAAPSVPAVDALTEEHDSSSNASSASAAAPAVDPVLAGAPDVAKVFGFDPPAAETPAP